MTKLHLIVKYEKTDEGSENVALIIFGAYKDLKTIHGSPAAAVFRDKRLIRPFLCGETMLVIPCEQYCSKHIHYKEVTNLLLNGYEFTVEFKDQNPWVAPGVWGIAALPQPEGLTPADQEMKRLLAEIAKEVDITISDKQVSVRLNHQHELTYATNAHMQKISGFIRHQLRECGYECEMAKLIIFDETEKYLLAKLDLIQQGDSQALKRGLDPRLAAKIKFEQPATAPALAL